MRSPARKQQAHNKRVQRKAAKRRAAIQARHAGKKTQPKAEPLFQRYVNIAQLAQLNWLLGERRAA